MSDDLKNVLATKMSVATIGDVALLLSTLSTLTMHANIDVSQKADTLLVKALELAENKLEEELKHEHN